ncbi:PhzF family phenazine biosynthesis protein [Flavobacterium sufflavum]|uniref:PhzF family phenazine biosynthesis protein n=1 Tax=Flavobacterium sufflavum TaxID=1921138 RepID=A0A3S2XIM0_9FLAO|nr:PhzF family phenazine biosynthesis protein [Flavobacterium sufflavum]RVT76684.1 PhzF family phenazine biosynthesis protein [Flavobacterium sufflavum]
MKIYQIDAFTKSVFSGNPAAVCPLEEWISDEIMLKIAAENNLAETAFYVKNGDKYEIRWFTPKVEVDLCGHATLAAAYVLFHYENHSDSVITFQSPRSGDLTVTKEGDLLSLNFPVDKLEPIPLTNEILDAFDSKPQLAFKGKTDYMLVFNNEEEILNLKPNFEKISKLNVRGVIVTAQGDNSDFVSRFFAPQSGVNEDPVTGSAHTTLIPYWAKELNKTSLSAIQLSERKGYLDCELLENRVRISGYAACYLIGNLFI